MSPPAVDPPATPASPRRWLLAFALPFGAVLLAVMGFNFWQDPYGRFTPEPQPLPQADVNSLNLALHSLVELHRATPAQMAEAEIVVLGESRAYPLTNARFGSVGGHPVVNLAFPGASFEEMLTMLESQAPRLTGARLLLVTISLDRLAADPRPDRCAESLDLPGQPLRYLLHRRTLEDAWFRLHHPRLPPTPAKKEERKVPAMGMTPASPNDERILLTWRTMRQNYQPARAQARLDRLRHILQPLQGKGVQVLFWTPPLRPDMATAMGAHGFDVEWAAVAAQVRQIAPLVDLIQATEIDGTPLRFADPSHHLNGALILAHLAARSGAFH